MINIATLNVKGLATRKKLSETLTLLKTYNHIDIFALQETNISTDKENQARFTWQLPSFWTKHTAFLINNKNINILDYKETDTRNISITILLNNKKYEINNLYLPPDRTDRKLYLETWSHQRNDNHHQILLGDLNMSILPQNRMSTTISHTRHYHTNLFGQDSSPLRCPTSEQSCNYKQPLHNIPETTIC